MTDERTCLPVGTVVELDGGERYVIDGGPIGRGGGSLLYPARRERVLWGVRQTDAIRCALKECYPASPEGAYRREENGAVVPRSEADALGLQRAQLLQLEEGEKSKRIYKTAARTLPVRTGARSVTLTLPGGTPAVVPNTVTVMDDLSEKGRSLTDWLRERRRLAPAEAMRVIQQVLFALREVHQAGYLHLDIQDGNVFLRGTLADGDELVTLIDFGCARALEGGQTAPIQDRVLFTTNGYSAPELLRKNDGTLRLGPQTDLYSVGCLALYLLTGRRADIRELMANRTGVYLRSNQLRRIQCPPHLTDTLQRILARALAPEPEDRYPSCEAMLADVSDLAEALRPYRSDLSGVKYDAFICYRHGPVDSAAALALQRALENYRAPKGVAGRRPFRRVFVDEGELSSCADFGRQIREALDNSGWLIVICSEATPASVWVRQEIDTFLQTHDRSRVLAVLTGGDPQSAFPPQLLGDAGGAGEVLAARALSTDARQAARNIRGDTLLKLAAPMLGTTFDTLKQRHRTYRLRRIAAAAVGVQLAVGAFAAYAVDRARVIQAQAVQIAQEYQRALVNESLLLAEQAEKRLDENDPMGAMELALRALPSPEQDRPVLAEAEFVLSKALGAYATPDSGENSWTPVGLIETECENFFLDPEGTRLFCWDGLDQVVQCWDAQELTLLWSVTLERYFSEEPLVSPDGGSLFVMYYNGVCCLDTATGRERWAVTLDSTRAAGLSQDGSRLALLASGNSQFSLEAARDLAVTALTLDAATGRQLERLELTIDGDRWIDTQVCFSPDLGMAAFSTADDREGNDFWYSHNDVYLLDLSTGRWTRLLTSETQVRAMRFCGDTLAVIRESGYTLRTQINATYDYVTSHTFYMECYSLDGALLWGQSYTDHICDSVSWIQETVRDDRACLLFVFGSRCVLFDQATGQTMGSYGLPADAVLVYAGEEGFQTVNADGTISFTITIYENESDALVNVYAFAYGVSQARAKNGAYFVQNDQFFTQDTTIRKYRKDWYDEHYTTLAELGGSWSLWGQSLDICGDKLLMTGWNQPNTVGLADLTDGSFRTWTIPEEYGFSEFWIEALTEDGRFLYWREGTDRTDPANWIGSRAFCRMDLETGQVERLTQPPQPRAYITAIGHAVDGHTMFFAASETEPEEGVVRLYAWDMEKGTLEELWQQPLGPWGQEGRLEPVYNSFELDRQQRRISLAFQTYSTRELTGLVCLDLDTGEATLLRLGEEARTVLDANRWQSGSCRWSASMDHVAFVCGDELLVVDAAGDPVLRHPLEQPLTLLLLAPDGELLTLSQDLLLTRYFLDGSAEPERVDLSAYGDGRYERKMELLPGGDVLLLDEASGGVVVERAQRGLLVKAVLDQCVGYDPDGDRFIVAEPYSAKTIGSFPRYTAADLSEWARGLLSPADH